MEWIGGDDVAIQTNFKMDTHTHRITMKILKNTTLVKSEIFLLNEWAADPFMTGSIFHSYIIHIQNYDAS